MEPSAETVLELLRAYDQEFLSSYAITFREDFPRFTAKAFPDRATWNAEAYGLSGEHILLETRDSFAAQRSSIPLDIVKTEWKSDGPKRRWHSCIAIIKH